MDGARSAARGGEREAEAEAEDESSADEPGRAGPRAKLESSATGSQVPLWGFAQRPVGPARPRPRRPPPQRVPFRPCPRDGPSWGRRLPGYSLRPREGPGPVSPVGRGEARRRVATGSRAQTQFLPLRPLARTSGPTRGPRRWSARGHPPAGAEPEAPWVTSETRSWVPSGTPDDRVRAHRPCVAACGFWEGSGGSDRKEPGVVAGHLSRGGLPGSREPWWPVPPSLLHHPVWSRSFCTDKGP